MFCRGERDRKTTFLHIIGLIEEFDSGRLLIDHKEITKRKDKLLYYRQKVCFLFQNFALIEGKTVVLVTHDEEIQGQCERIIYLN